MVDSRNAQLDVDKDGETRALTDGLLIIRHLFGFEGQSLVSGAVGPLSDLSDTEIAANLRALEGDGTLMQELPLVEIPLGGALMLGIAVEDQTTMVTILEEAVLMMAKLVVDQAQQTEVMPIS